MWRATKATTMATTKRSRIEEANCMGRIYRRGAPLDRDLSAETRMNQDVFNLEVRQFLKKFGITAQREIERGVAAAMETGALKGNEKLNARAELRVDGFPDVIIVEGEIRLE